MNYLSDLENIIEEIKSTKYKNRSSLTWLKKKLKESIETIQLMDVVEDISNIQIVDNIKDIRKQLIHYSSMKDCFDVAAKELLLELKSVKNRNT